MLVLAAYIYSWFVYILPPVSMPGASAYIA